MIYFTFINVVEKAKAPGTNPRDELHKWTGRMVYYLACYHINCERHPISLGNRMHFITVFLNFKIIFISLLYFLLLYENE